MAEKERKKRVFLAVSAILEDTQSRDTIHLQPPPASSECKFNLPSRVSKTSVSITRFVFMLNTFMSII